MLYKLSNLPSKLIPVIEQGSDFSDKKAYEQRGMYTLKYPDDFRKAQDNDGILFFS
jgi:hypothetical protein